jgi:hypothetical protein
MPKPGQDHDVDFGVAEEPEEVLVEDRVAAALRAEEVRPEIAVGEQHGDRAGEDRQASSSRKAVTSTDQTKSGILCSVMPGRAHVEDGGDEVDRARIDEAPARWSEKIAMSTAGPGRAGGRERRIDRPADARAVADAARHEGRAQKQDEGRRKQPEADIVHPRKAMSGAPIMIGRTSCRSRRSSPASP